MDESGNDFLAGLLQFASLPESIGNSPTPPQPPGSGFRCGFCLSVKYKNQSSLDSHIKECARSNDYTAKFWQEAGWTRAGLQIGFNFQHGFPVVKADRICRYCKITFANAKEVLKHVAAARCRNAQAIQDASPAITSKQWKCGFCPKQRCYTTEFALDTHIKLCAPRNGYVARFWREAGWEPGSRHGKGLDFEDGVATVRNDRICQACYQCCKSLKGLTRHLEHRHCSGEPDEVGLKPPPPPPSETIAHFASRGIVMERQRLAGPAQSSQTVEYKRLEAALKPSIPSKGSGPSKPSPTVSTELKGSGVSLGSVATSQPETMTGGVSENHQQAAKNVSKPTKAEEESPKIEFLSEVINTKPSREVTIMLIKVARADPACRAIPSAPLHPRQKRPRESDADAQLANRTKLAREEG